MSSARSRSSGHGSPSSCEAISSAPSAAHTSPREPYAKAPYRPSVRGRSSGHAPRRRWASCAACGFVGELADHRHAIAGDAAERDTSRQRRRLSPIDDARKRRQHLRDAFEVLQMAGRAQRCVGVVEFVGGAGQRDAVGERHRVAFADHRHAKRGSTVPAGSKVSWPRMLRVGACRKPAMRAASCALATITTGACAMASPRGVEYGPLTRRSVRSVRRPHRNGASSQLPAAAHCAAHSDAGSIQPPCGKNHPPRASGMPASR